MNNVLLCVTETAHVKRNKKPNKKKERKKEKKSRRRQPASVVQQLSIKQKTKCLRTNVNRIYKCVVQTSKKQTYSWKKSMPIVKTIY